MRRILSLTTAIAVLVVATTAVTASSASASASLTSSQARTQAKAFVRKRAMSQNNANNPHGVPTNWGVVRGSDCDPVSRSTIECAYGIFWADGHQCFNIARVHGVRTRRGVFIAFTVSRRFSQEACDDDGTTNGGSSTPGTATDIDPGGRGPLQSSDDEEEAPTGDASE